jgi:hypothetical protein
MLFSKTKTKSIFASISHFFPETYFFSLSLTVKWMLPDVTMSELKTHTAEK